METLEMKQLRQLAHVSRELKKKAIFSNVVLNTDANDVRAYFESATLGELEIKEVRSTFLLMSEPPKWHICVATVGTSSLVLICYYKIPDA